MRAAIAHTLRRIDELPLRLEAADVPAPGPRQVRVRVRCCAVCRTDLHVIEGDLPRATLPIIPGHQVVGEVEKLGAACKRFTRCQRIGIAWLRRTCGRCGYCMTGRENLCDDARFTGYHEHGGYAEYAVIDEDFAYAIPDEFDDLQAAPLLCAGIIGYRALKRANPVPGCRIALIGFGSSAHIVLPIARHRGYEVYVTARSPEHRKLAHSMGAAWSGEHPNQLPTKMDSAILFAPSGSLVPPMLAKLRKGGTLACAGIHMTDIPAMKYAEQIFEERDLRSVTCNTREDGRELLREAAAAGVKPHIQTYPLAEANRALLDMKSSRVNGTAVLVMT